MAIIISTPQEGKVTVELDNGHVEALKKIVEEYRLLGEKEAVSFMLSLLSQANGTPIEINGTKYVPPDNFKKPTSI